MPATLTNDRGTPIAFETGIEMPGIAKGKPSADGYTQAIILMMKPGESIYIPFLEGDTVSRCCTRVRSLAERGNRLTSNGVFAVRRWPLEGEQTGYRIWRTK